MAIIIGLAMWIAGSAILGIFVGLTIARNSDEQDNPYRDWE
jgi:hypothetical protein